MVFFNLIMSVNRLFRQATLQSFSGGGGVRQTKKTSAKMHAMILKVFKSYACKSSVK